MLSTGLSPGLLVTQGKAPVLAPGVPTARRATATRLLQPTRKSTTRKLELYSLQPLEHFSWPAMKDALQRQDFKGVMEQSRTNSHTYTCGCVE